ncbi:MAG: oligosaccharide flippase family protein [bacterium]
MPDLGHQYARNVYFSWIQVVARAATAFFFVPFAAHLLGGSRYGLWVILFQIVNYFSLLDGGLASALLRFVPKALAGGDVRRVNQILSTANLLYLATGLLALAGVWGFANFGMGLFEIPDLQILAEGRQALTILAVYLMLRFWLLPYGNSLAAFQRSDLGQLLEAAELLLRTLVMAGLLWWGYGLVPLAASVVVMSLLRHLVGMVVLHKIQPALRFSLKAVDRATAGSLFEYSSISLAIAVCTMLLLQSEAILLGALYSTAAAGIYFAGAQIINQMRLFLNAVGAPLIPVLAHVESQQGSRQPAALYLRGLKYLAYLMGWAGTSIILLSGWFTRLWLPTEFAQAGVVMSILAVGAMFSLPQTIGEALCYGTGRHSQLLKFLVVEVACKIGLTLWLVPVYGVLGMAWAGAGPQVVLYLVLYPWLMQEVSGLPWYRIVVQAIVPAALGGALAAGVLTPVIRIMPPDNWWRLIVGVSLAGVVGLAVGWRWVLAEEDRLRFLSGGRHRPKSHKKG